MERRRTPVRLAGLAAALLVAVGGLAACDGTGLVGQPPAATVEGHHITRKEVLALLKAQDRELKKEPSSSKASELHVDGLTTSDFNVTSASFVLSSLIKLRAYQAGLDRLGIEVSSADRKAARSLLEASSGGAGSLDKVDPALISYSVDLEAAKLAYSAQAQLDSLAQSRQVCIAWIVTTDQATIADAQTKVRQGQDFGTVAKADSSDPSSSRDGVAGCGTAAQLKNLFGADVGALKVGSVGGPYTIAGGTDASGAPVKRFALIKVIRFTLKDIEAQLSDEIALATSTDSSQAQAIQQAQQSLQGAVSAGELKAEAEITKLKITVDPRYGTWDAKTGEVVPPLETATSTTTTTSTTLPPDTVGQP